MLKRDYYTVLGVSRTESASGIRAAFRELVRRYHPERIGPQGAHFMQELLTAYQVLSDPDKRRHYDQGLWHAEGRGAGRRESIMTGSARQHSPAVPALVPALRRFVTILPPLDTTLTQVLRNFARPAAQTNAPMQSVNVQVVLSPAEAARGGLATVQVPVYYPCKACGGSGQDWLFPCSACEAQGMLEEEEAVRVQIPPLVSDYTLIEMPLRGLGLHNLYLRLYVRVVA
ncbi:MAG: DnaJ domain-containing protein [Candidatus Binatia bacterium]